MMAYQYSFSQFLVSPFFTISNKLLLSILNS